MINKLKKEIESSEYMNNISIDDLIQDKYSIFLLDSPENFEVGNKGSSRRILLAEDKVYKIALNENGLIQNKKELEIFSSTKSKHLSTIYRSIDLFKEDSMIIEMEEVLPLQGFFAIQLNKYPFDKTNNEVSYDEVTKMTDSLFKNSDSLLVIHAIFKEIYLLSKENDGFSLNIHGVEKLNEVIKRQILSHSVSKLGIEDLNSANLGIAMNRKIKELVILDYGYTPEVTKISKDLLVRDNRIIV